MRIPYFSVGAGGAQSTGAAIRITYRAPSADLRPAGPGTSDAAPEKSDND